MITALVGIAADIYASSLTILIITTYESLLPFILLYA